MKIVMLNGQNHKGSTYHIGRMIAEKIEGGNEIIEIFFPRDLNHFCIGCYKCIEDTSACPFYAEKQSIIDKIDAADILIVTTPTYCMHMSAPLKSFFDLTFDLWMSHRPMKSMFHKKAVIVSTAAGTGMKSAMKDVEDCLFYMGVPEIMKYGIAVQAMNWDGVSEEKKKAIDVKTSAIAKKLGKMDKTHVGIKTRVMFMIMGMMQKKGWNSSPIETKYWKDHGWLDGKETMGLKGEQSMSRIQLINGSCADQNVDAIVNAANRGLWAGGGICGVIFKKAGREQLTAECNKHKTPLKDGDAVITSSCNMTNVKGIIHAVGPDFGVTPEAFEALFDAYYNSLKVLMENGYHSISFPLISSGIFGGSLPNPVEESTKQCCMAYQKFVEDYPEYEIDVLLCAFSLNEMIEAKNEFDRQLGVES